MKTPIAGSLFILLLTMRSAARADLPKVPDGFTVRLVASVPAVEFPCQVATGPGGLLFIAEDPMDQRGPYEAFDGRILLVRDGQEPVVFADKFRAIQGMAWHRGSLYVCHMPFLTVIRDTDGDGKADERKDLFKDLGPTNNQGLNDHIVSGIQFGIDGWLYISVGDKGVPGATRPEDGQKVQLRGGGTLRCRPDGTELEVFSSGTRNHLEPNLDAADNLITYDNTDDGDGWWTRVTHHIYNGYYGYPYDYHDHPERFLPPMGEYGGGSPCGAVFYRDDAWPDKYRGIGLWAEWGKGKVHAFRFEPVGATFKIAEEIDFAVPNGTGDFRPIDLALSYDGNTLYVADWNMGGWGSKTEKVGRVWAINYAGESKPAPAVQIDTVERCIAALSHPAYTQRMRAQDALIERGEPVVPEITTALRAPSTPALTKRHLIWSLDAIAGATPEASVPLIELLRSPVADLRAQAARALGERRVPIALQSLFELTRDPEPTVRLQAITALNRIGSEQATAALTAALADSDRFVAFAARQALRRIGAWKALGEEFKNVDSSIQKAIVLTCEGVYDPQAVNLLVEVSNSQTAADELRTLAVRALAQVSRKAKPWDGRWWGTRPSQGKPPAKVDDWEATDRILTLIDRMLDDRAPNVREASATALFAVNAADKTPHLRKRLESETDGGVRVAIIKSLGALRDTQSTGMLARVLEQANETDAVRDAAIQALDSIGSEAASPVLLALLEQPRLAREQRPRVIAILGKFREEKAVPRLLAFLTDEDAATRVACATALGQIRTRDGVVEPLRERLADANPDVRRAVITALASLGDHDSVPQLIKAVDDAETRFEAMRALNRIGDIRALRIYLRGLADKNPDLRTQAGNALRRVRDEAIPVLEQLAERKEIPPSIVPELRRVYSSSKSVTRWKVLGPFARSAADPINPESELKFDAMYPGLDDKEVRWRDVRLRGPQSSVNLSELYGGDQRKAYAFAEIDNPQPRHAELVVGSDDTLTVWINGKQVYNFEGDRGFTADQDRVEVDLPAGKNRVLVRCGNSSGGWEFAVALSSPTNYIFLSVPSADAFNPEKYVEFARANTGDAERGRKLFSDPKGLACIKCHKAGADGGDVGPDLAGIGVRYGRDELIDSILYPSAKIFSGYEPQVVATRDGQVITGILKSEDAQNLVLADNEARLITIPKAEIEERRTSDVSLMPNGLAEGLSTQDFADLVGYLQSLKEAPSKPDSSKR